ncbi:hypothetical protein J1605_006844 [Eschrichtius robustus]|uniref:Uncharacterized protein n=1 Tax=Eschrichtius robustus TaxID=9764 RepID=A0AB34H5A3_ESCRO|nr:hypothetical protein J1605_006844 [Eschrichtius robustus]
MRTRTRDAGGGSRNGPAPSACAGHVGARPAVAAAAVTGAVAERLWWDRLRDCVASAGTAPPTPGPGPRTLLVSLGAHWDFGPAPPSAPHHAPLD